MILKINNYYFYTQHFDLIMQMDCDLFEADINFLHVTHMNFALQRVNIPCGHVS